MMGRENLEERDLPHLRQYPGCRENLWACTAALVHDVDEYLSKGNTSRTHHSLKVRVDPFEVYARQMRLVLQSCMSDDTNAFVTC